jgi:hypothetical protein
VLLVVTYSKAARTSLRNVCRRHEESVARRFGRAALLETTHHGAFLACRLREKHPEDVQVERTVPFNEYSDVPEEVRTAAAAYEDRASAATPYARFATGRELPSPEQLRDREL